VENRVDAGDSDTGALASECCIVVRVLCVAGGAGGVDAVNCFVNVGRVGTETGKIGRGTACHTDGTDHASSLTISLEQRKDIPRIEVD
jgi:hypothetical protein